MGCRIEFVDGELTCLTNHYDIENCDLYKAHHKQDEDEANKMGITLEGYYGGKNETISNGQ